MYKEATLLLGLVVLVYYIQNHRSIIEPPPNDNPPPPINLRPPPVLTPYDPDAPIEPPPNKDPPPPNCNNAQSQYKIAAGSATYILSQEQYQNAMSGNFNDMFSQYFTDTTGNFTFQALVQGGAVRVAQFTSQTGPYYPINCDQFTFQLELMDLTYAVMSSITNIMKPKTARQFLKHDY